MQWIENKLFLRGCVNKSDHLFYPLKIAAFDLDDTLIYKTKSSLNLVDSKIIKKIEQLVKKDFIIVVFTNQSGMF